METRKKGKFDSFYNNILSNFLKSFEDFELCDAFVFYGHSDTAFLETVRQGFETIIKEKGLDLWTFAFPQIPQVIRENDRYYLVNLSWFIEEKKLLYESINGKKDQVA